MFYQINEMKVFQQIKYVVNRYINKIIYSSKETAKIHHRVEDDMILSQK